MITEKRKKQIIKEAKADFLDAYECGQLNDYLLDEKDLKQAGYTKEEIKLYIQTFEELMYK